MSISTIFGGDSRAGDIASTSAMHRLPTAGILAVAILALLAAAGLANRVLPEPDIVDFRGLTRICLLMERRGWQHCVNHNWGFAVPLTTYLAAKLTGDLLIGQRIVSALFALLALVLAERVMTRVLGVRNSPAKGFVLVWMALSPWMLEALVSVHLDVAAVACVLAAILLLSSSRLAAHALGGLFAAMALWFRFHFLFPALLYVPLVAVYRRGDRGLARGAVAAVGVLLGLLVPALLGRVVMGTPGVSNAKQAIMSDCVYAISSPGPRLAEFRDVVPYSADFHDRLGRLSWGRLLRGVPWPGVVRRMIRNCLSPLFMLFLTALTVHALTRHPHAAGERPDAEGRTDSQLARRWDCPIVQLGAFILVSLLPFLFLRGHTLRLEATFLLLAFPLFAALLSDRQDRVLPGLLLALFLLSISGNRQVLAGYRQRAEEVSGYAREIRSVIPERTLREHPERVYSVVEFYNPFNRWRTCSPLLPGGFGLLSSAMCEEFGVIDPGRTPDTRLYESIEYVILPGQPGGGGGGARLYERAAQAMLTPDMDTVTTANLIIVHRTPK